MTRTRAGITPAKSVAGPSSRRIERSVARVEGAFLGLELVGRTGSSVDSDFRAVIRVLTTQIGLVKSTVAEPANAPAAIDSIVVSLFDGRPAVTAARSKNARDHSYPVGVSCQSVGTTNMQAIEGSHCWQVRTVVVHKIRNADAEKGGVEACVQSCNPLSLQNAPDCIERTRTRAFGLHLGAGGECYQGVPTWNRLD